MGSNVQVQAGLNDLSKRLRTVAETLKSLPADYAPDKIENLCDEVRAIATQLRRN